MIRPLLDTNVLSEVMKPRPATKVIDWMAGQAAADLYTTSITQAGPLPETAVTISR